MGNRRHRFCPDCDPLEVRSLLSGYIPAAPGGYAPSQITNAYGLNAIAFTTSNGSTVKGDGAGETIALIEMYNDPNLQSDLKTFDAQFGLPDPVLTVVNQAGNATDTSWGVEQSLDVEWAHAIAPGANILVVEAAPSYSQTQGLQNLLTAVNAARNTPGVVSVSMSWGYAEMPGEASYDSYFTTPAGHTGITFLAASGDDGFVEYPSASPNVVSVGGTSLNLDGLGTYSSETAWTSSGGGYSRYEPEPNYQQSVQQTGARSTPDVAFDGDPNTGVAVYATAPGSNQGSWQVVAGTSLGAPAWAGIIAIVDEGRELQGIPSLDGRTQTLPSLYAAPSNDFNSVAAAQDGAGFPGRGFMPFARSAFTDITIGNGNSEPPALGATANTATGLGSPIGPSLVSNLISSTLTVPLSTPALSASPPKHARKHHKQHPHATSRARAHQLKLHERKLAEQHKHSAANREPIHAKNRA